MPTYWEDVETVDTDLLQNWSLLHFLKYVDLSLLIMFPLSLKACQLRHDSCGSSSLCVIFPPYFEPSTPRQRLFRCSLCVFHHTFNILSRKHADNNSVLFHYLELQPNLNHFSLFNEGFLPQAENRLTPNAFKTKWHISEIINEICHLRYLSCGLIPSSSLLVTIVTLTELTEDQMEAKLYVLNMKGPNPPHSI